MLTDFEKRSLPGVKAVTGESNSRLDHLFSPRIALVSFILVTGANIALLSVVVRQLLKKTSSSDRDCRVMAKEQRYDNARTPAI